MLFTKSEQVYLQKRPQPAKPHNNKMEEKHILIIAHQTDLKKNLISEIEDFDLVFLP